MKILYEIINKSAVILTFYLTAFLSGTATVFLLLWIQNNLIDDAYSLPFLWFVIMAGLPLSTAIFICIMLIKKGKISTDISFLGEFTVLSHNSRKSYLSVLILGIAGGLFYFSIINLHYLLYAR